MLVWFLGWTPLNLRCWKALWFICSASCCWITSLVGHEDEHFIDSGPSPAGILSRGNLLSTLNDSDFLYSGPKQVLYSDTLPTGFSTLCEDDLLTLLSMENPSTKREKLVILNCVIDVKCFSSYLKLLRVASYVLRFISRLKNKMKNKLSNLHLVNNAELKQAELL